MMKAMKIILPVFAAVLAVMFALTLEPVSASQHSVSNWGSLKDAINYADESDVIVLTENIKAGDTDEPLVVPGSTPVTIDLNGHVLDRNLFGTADNGNLFIVKGSLTIIDSRPDMLHKDGDNDIYSYQIGTRTVGVTGGIITGGNISGNGGAIYVEGGKSLILNGGTIIGNRASAVDGANGNDTGQGGGVYIGGGGTFEMNGGAVAGNVASSSENGDDRYRRGDGGGVFIAGSTFDLNGGTVAGNTADRGNMTYPDHCGNGGGVYLSDGTLNMMGGSIEGNTSVGDSGGGVYMSNGSSNSVLNMEGGTIVNNSAVNGGGVCAEEYNCSIHVKDASIAGNHANTDGGGVHLTSGELYLEEGGEISDNTAGGNGGGVFFNSVEGADSYFCMNDGAISGNQAAADGGGVYHGYLETGFDMKGGIISDNIAGGYGGGVDVLYGSMAMTGGTITGNRAATGGGVCARNYFSIAGKSEINDNLHGNDANAVHDDVYIEKYSNDRVIGIAGELNNETPIGIWIDPQYLGTVEQRTLTGGYGEHIGAGDPAEHFVSENDGYTAGWNNDGTELLLTNSAEVLNYTADGYEGFYDGGEHSINVNVTEPQTGVTIQYRAVGDQDYQAEPPTYTNAGEYEVEYFIRAEGVEHSVRNKETVTIKAKAITPKMALSTSAYTYNGKAKKPSVTVKYGSKTLANNTDYTVTYASGRKNVGTYKVTVKLKGNYSGSASKTFKINPKGTAMSKVAAGTKSFTAYWKKQTKQTTGYQIQYSKAKSFKSGNKLVTISKSKTASRKIAKLKAKKKYYVRVRTYKKIGTTMYYSVWSSAKAVTTK